MVSATSLKSSPVSHTPSLELHTNPLSAKLFFAASYLTDPLCWAHTYYRLPSVTRSLHPADSKIMHYTRQTLLGVKCALWSLPALFTTLPAIALRVAGVYLQKHSFLHVTSSIPSKPLPETHSFNICTWNTAGCSAGHCITNAGVVPLWATDTKGKTRAEKVIEHVLHQGADVICLQEVFDIQLAWQLCEGLKHTYKHFFFHAGTPKEGVGVGSAQFIASKFEISSAEFTPFPQEMLSGRTKYSGKGFFNIGLTSQGQEFARFFTTHLQHSEASGFPTAEEEACRNLQMALMSKTIDTVAKEKLVLVLGDDNCGDEEYTKTPWAQHLIQAPMQPPTAKTWGGDTFCASTVGDKPSEEMNLDRLRMRKTDDWESEKTVMISSSYDGKTFHRDALSDHNALLGKFTRKPLSG